MSSDGGAAFPHGDGEFGGDGMSLRDYFAAKAMAAIISMSGVVHDRALSELHPEIAQCAYMMADAMLKARGR
jgi:hypothetical protein